MGMFIMPRGDTVEDYLTAAKESIDLFSLQKNPGYEYLLDNAETFIRKAKNIYVFSPQNTGKMTK